MRACTPCAEDADQDASIAPAAPSARPHLEAAVVDDALDVIRVVVVHLTKEGAGEGGHSK